MKLFINNFYKILGACLCFMLLIFEGVQSDCRYRSLNVPKNIFQYWASWGCYIYTRPDFFNGTPIELQTCPLHLRSRTYFVPGIRHKNSTFCHPFHHSSKFVARQVEKSFLNNRTLMRWIECTNDAEDCCADVMDNDVAVDNHCPSVWDGWSCFRSIPAGQTYKLPCSRFAYGNEGPRCHHFSYKECYHNATWNQQTDYTTCDVTPPLIARNKYYIVILMISTVFCTPALMVLFLTKANHSQKLRIVRALLLAICIHNMMVILVRTIIIMPELTTLQPTSTTMYQNSVICRVLTVLEKLSGNFVFGCMLLIGIFLHQLLTNLFRIHDRKNGALMLPFYIGTGVICVASVSWWSVIMAKYNDQYCWQVSEDFRVDWILDGPRLGMLCVNLLLLLHITVRLWHAFNAKETDDSPFLRALRAALICLPVFGMQFLFLIIRPDMDNCGTEQFYYITNYSVAGAQGIFIAIFHCYTEREVSKYFKECWFNLKKKFFRRDSVISKCSTVNETQQELVNNISSSKLRSEGKLILF
ncbi:corticotropin-releasing factor receptor 1-like [Eupeodes corollae]|uniref:corticotropin-releasing factor receptor 1-like n=1 Tax=Eupeodes corollae TaxID=290404 RepID=UPI0024938589|nr:corticotropin-releasing factor receptor 1-like [Eupeodes corollae]